MWNKGKTVVLLFIIAVLVRWTFCVSVEATLMNNCHRHRSKACGFIVLHSSV